MHSAGIVLTSISDLHIDGRDLFPNAIDMFRNIIVMKLSFERKEAFQSGSYPVTRGSRTHADDPIGEYHQVQIDTSHPYTLQPFLARIILDNLQLALLPSRLCARRFGLSRHGHPGGQEPVGPDPRSGFRCGILEVSLIDGSEDDQVVPEVLKHVDLFPRVLLEYIFQCKRMEV
jgi:hypothetical protein